MFTPQEVSEKVFPKSSFGSGGYAMAAVDEFLDTLTEDYTALYKENVALKAKLKVLAEKVEEYRATEDAMRSTLLTAQRMAAKLVQEAQEEKDNLLNEARAQHAAEIRLLDDETNVAKQKLALAQQNLADFIQRSRALCEEHAAFLTSLPELVPAVEAAPVAAAPVESDLASEIRSVFDTVEPAVDEDPTVVMEPVQFEAAEEVAAPAAEEIVDDYTDDVIPSDFKLSLDELKFGRNYSAED
ncbi:MAG: DivIVA domain-containing protein [Oscillospiraceae bacterium]|nr:DivIVA domain-containing protein [Oscillospiraceae bacterium]